MRPTTTSSITPTSERSAHGTSSRTTIVVEWANDLSVTDEVNAVFGANLSKRTGSFYEATYDWYGVPSYNRNNFTAFAQADYRPIPRLKLIAGGQLIKIPGFNTHVTGGQSGDVSRIAGHRPSLRRPAGRRRHTDREPRREAALLRGVSPAVGRRDRSGPVRRRRLFAGGQSGSEARRDRHHRRAGLLRQRSRERGGHPVRQPAIECHRRDRRVRR